MLTDMVGFASLTQRNETLALRLLEEHRSIVRPVISEFHGREVKTLGDGFLLEFESALNATNCALEIQRRLEERNRRSGAERIQLRIGLHVGDVVHEAGDVYGDAVNIASRLEPLADPGGIVVSGSVVDQVRGKLDAELDRLPTPSLKHISLPVEVYRVGLPWHGSGVGGIGHTTPWIDRDQELEEIRSAAARALRGEPQVVLLHGAAGVGKSRLAEESLHHIEGQGFRLLTTRAFRGEGTDPYAPWVRLLRSFARDSPLELLRQVCGAYSDEVAKLAPEVRDRLGTVAPAATLDPEAANRRFLEGLSQFLLNLSAAKPLVVLFDDLQWADAASLRLLELVVRQFGSHRLLLLAAARAADPGETAELAPLLLELRRARRLVTVEVRRFGRDEFERFLTAVLQPSRLTPETHATIFERSGGNPFFAEEIVRTLISDGTLVFADRAWSLHPGAELRLPDSIRAILRERVHGMDPPTLALLRAASVAGPTFSADLLQTVVEMDDESFLTAIERAYQRRILEERRLGPGRSELAFTDPQIGVALYEDIPPVLRHRLHRKVAAALERLEPEGAGRRAHEIGRHYLEANDPQKALPHVRHAAAQAETVFAREEARRLYETALEILADSSDDRARAEVAEALGAQFEALGHPKDAIRCWGDAARLRAAAGDLRAAAGVERRLGYARRQYLQDSAGALAALESARAKLEPLGDSPELAAVYGDLGDLAWYARDARTAREMCEKALAIAGRTGAADTEGWSYLILASLSPPERSEELFAFLHRMLKIGEEHHLPEVMVGAYHNLAAATFYVRGDWHGGLALIDQGAKVAREVRNRAGEMFLSARLAPLLLIGQGELDRAAATAESMLDYVALFSAREEPLSLVALASVAYQRGDLARAEQLAARANEVLRVSPDWSIQNLADGVLGSIYLERGDHAAAARAVQDSIRGARAMGVSAWGAAAYLRLVSILVAAATAEPTGVKVDTPIQEMVAEARRLAALLPSSPVAAFALEISAVAGHVDADCAEAISDMRGAIDQWTRLGWPFERARLSVRLADRLDRSRQTEAARPLRETAQDIFRSMGARRSAT